MSFYNTMIAIFRPIIRVLFRLTVTGAEKIPKEGKLIVCANHTSMLDVAVIITSMPRKINFMGKKEIFKIPLVGAFFRAMGAFPVDRGGGDVGAIKKTVSIIEEGGAVSIFPQGTRHQKEDPSKTEVKHGIGMMAYRSGADVLPLFIKAKNNHLHFFGKSELIVGDVIKYEELGFENGGKAEYEHAARCVFSRICALGGYDFPVSKDGE
ncbi:MAG: 1-acyl-sn-glycerol-3-phosphate acyltransferase [Ruminococcaceae bacterium]|nr:1-acyl-sn-glycerol-3-phosphate acyltransferase [Oscillospiraceae bacterium]